MDKPIPRVRVSVILPRRDRLLLVLHRKPDRSYWMLPGGGIEYGESIEQCAEREMLEETGLLITVKRLVYISEAIAPDGSRHIFNVFVLARQVGGALCPSQDQVVARSEFVEFKRLPELTIFPPIVPQLLHLRESRYRGPISYLGCLWEP